MSTLTRLSYSLALLVTVAFTTAPAHAQFEGTGDQMAQFAPMMEQFAPMMEQFAPMMQRMTSKIGKKRMGRMMQMAAPMVASMMPPGGDMPGMENVMSMMGDGPTRRVGRRHKWPVTSLIEDCCANFEGNGLKRISSRNGVFEAQPRSADDQRRWPTI